MKREKSILNILSNNYNYITGKQLAKILNVSDRTIRSDISKINQMYDCTIIESDFKLGYRLNLEEYYKKCNQNESIPQNSDQRINYIIRKLFDNNRPINLNNLANNIYISEYSIENDIKKIKILLQPYPNLQLIKKNNFLSLSGDEYSKRSFYKKCLEQEINQNFLNIDDIQQLYTDFDLSIAKNILEDILQKYNYTIQSDAMPQILIHLGIVINRLLNNNSIENLNINKQLKSATESEIANDLFTKLNQIYNIQTNQNEIYLFSLLLISKKENKNSKTQNIINNNLHSLKIVSNLIEFIIHEYGIDFSNDEDFKMILSLHIDSLIARKNISTLNSNPYLNEIKNSFPFIFDFSVSCVNYLSKLLNISINEDEIGYIALHLGNAYRRISKNLFRTIIIYPKNSAFIKFPIDRITHIFQDYLEIIDIHNYFDANKIINQKADLIISAFPINHKLNILTVNISMFFSYKDESIIHQAISILKKQKIKKQYSHTLKSLLVKENFMINKQFKNDTSALKYICNHLYQNNFTEQEFFDSVLEREKLSKTGFSHGFCLPHCLNTQLIKKSTILVCILDTPILWGQHEIRIIFMMAIKEIDNEILQLFFDWITELTSDLYKFEKVLNCKSYTEFLNILDI